jgi:hypothetical protein
MTKRILEISLLITFFSMMGGCSALPTGSLATPWPTDYLPTAIALTLTANPSSPNSAISIPTTSISTPLPGILPGNTPTPLEKINTLESSLTPTSKYRKTLTPTPTPTNPEAVIQIISPGSLSKVVSPIQIIAYAKPGYGNKVIVELIGEDGKVLTQESLFYQDLPRLWGPVNLDLSFKINSVAEFARLQIRTEDQFKRTIALLPVHLILLSDGINRIYPNVIQEERCVLHSPKPDDESTGGILILDGEFLPFNNQPIIIDLISETGIIVGTTSIQFDPTTNDILLPFKTSLYYQVDSPTSARLTLHQPDQRIPGNLFVFSQLIHLKP